MKNIIHSENNQKAFRKIDSLDKKYKPLILKWLSNVFGYENYHNSFRDQFIIWDTWDGQLTVIFDTRGEEQARLLSLIHPRFIGTPQYGTLKIVNTNTFYLDLNTIIRIKYPDIINSNLIHKNKHVDNDGDIFYTYDWEVFLSDGTSIYYNNQSEKMDMIKGDFIYNSTIQQRTFIKFLNNLNNN